MNWMIFCASNAPVRCVLGSGLPALVLSFSMRAGGAEGAAAVEPGPSEMPAHQESRPSEAASNAADAALSPAALEASVAEVPPEESAVPVAPAVASPPAEAALEARVLAAPPKAEPPAPAPVDPNLLPLTYHQKHIDAQLAFGPGWLTDSGVEPYSSSEGVPLLSLRLGGAPIAVGRFAFAVLASGTYGSVSGDVRGLRSSLEFGVLGVGLEARYHFHHLFYGFVRISPGAAFSQTSVLDGQTNFSGDGWAPIFGGHLGGAVRIAGPAEGTVRAPRVWLLLEAGYRYSGNYALTLRAPEDSLVNAAELSMPPFSLSGPDANVALALTF